MKKKLDSVMMLMTFVNGLEVLLNLQAGHALPVGHRHRLRRARRSVDLNTDKAGLIPSFQ
jgi:hypothetical protein